MDEKLKQMKALIQALNAASASYYNTGTEIMPNKEWDALYDELKGLEWETGVTLSASPTQHIGYEPVSKLAKEYHEIPALSLDKTKDIEQLKAFQGDRPCILSWKFDGLTIVATYEDGHLVKAVTRGNGTTGEVITENAKAFANLPVCVSEKEKMIVRGEAIITYEDFDRINEMLPEGEEKYKNPRNLCSGSVRQLDPKETLRRNVQFKAFSLSGGPKFRSRLSQLEYLGALGFDVEDFCFVPDASGLEETIQEMTGRVKNNAFPADGLVLQFDDIAYGESLGSTYKFPRDSMAFKWEDATKETTLHGIEWSASRTGLINPVAVFDPVELEGTTVSRASVHNVSILEKLALCPGDTITVYKANMIIPQVEENLTRSGKPEIPCRCPACSGPVVLHFSENAGEYVKSLHCKNPRCPAKQAGLFRHAVSRDALNVDGLSEETLLKFMDTGLLQSLPDLFTLKDKKDEIVSMEGFGEKSFTKLMTSIEQARHTDLQKLLYAMGIENVGRTASKAICTHFEYDVLAVINAPKETLMEIPGVGGVIADAYVKWFENQLNQELFEAMLAEVILEKQKPAGTQGMSLEGKTYVITGSLAHFKNRGELKAEIERLGGKVSGSVSSKTTALINNDITSTSGKNKSAKGLGVPIITEDEFLNMTGIYA